MSTSNHIKVLNTFTERRHHTRHGLHLNKKGRNWIVNSTVNGIKNWNLTLYSASLPIELPWKDERNDFGKQTSLIIVSVDRKCLSPSHKNDDHLKSGNSTAAVDSLSQNDGQPESEDSAAEMDILSQNDVECLDQS